MPVPVNALARNARPIKHKTKLASNPAELLACNEDLAAENQCKDLWIGPFFNGFVMGALEVWSGHHHLLIKPKDVWFAILTQLGPYIDKHGQGAAQLYVSHEGRRELELVLHGSRHSLDYRVFIKQMGTGLTMDHT